MRNRKIFIVSGAWIAVLPYLGFPLLFKNILLTLSGIGVGVLAYFLLKSEEGKSAETYENFSESRQVS